MTLLNALVDQIFKCQLLTPLFDEILLQLAVKAKESNITSTCSIIYAWPIHPDETDLQGQVLHLAECLTRAGVDVVLDITKGDILTHFETATVEWIQLTMFTLMVCSTTFAERAKDPTSLTHREALELSAKKAQRDGSVIPILMTGRAASSLPPEYSEVLCSDFRNPVQFLLDLPSIIAKLLHLQQDDDMTTQLTKYQADAQHILQGTVPPDPEQCTLFHEQQHKYWSSRVAVLTSKFTLDQLKLLDGRIAHMDARIDSYCVRMTKDTITVPDDLTLGSLPLETQLLGFLQGKERVLLLQSPKGAGKSFLCRFLAVKAWESKHWIPVFVNLDPNSQAPENCVVQSLQSHGLDIHTINHAQATRSFLILIEGFDLCKMQVNPFVKLGLSRWQGKAVVTSRSSYLTGAPYAAFYFMPATPHNLPSPQDLQILSFTTKHSLPKEGDQQSITETVQIPVVVLAEAKVTATVLKSKRIREQWQRAKDQVCTQVQLVQDCALNPTTIHSRALAFYIPLKGGSQPDTPPNLYFDVSKQVHAFLKLDSTTQLLLIQGNAGSGKSLFSRLLEKDLWISMSQVPDGIFPLFIDLPKAADPYHNLVEDSLHDLGFSQEDIPFLRATFRFIFILDGLDELSLDHIPTHGLVDANQLLQWPNSKIIIAC